jgi:hypothetical protein
MDVPPQPTRSRLTRSGHERNAIAAMHGPELLYFPDFRFVVSAMRRREFITLLGGSTAISPRRACGASSVTVDGPK